MGIEMMLGCPEAKHHSMPLENVAQWREYIPSTSYVASLIAQLVKNLPAI